MTAASDTGLESQGTVGIGYDPAYGPRRAYHAPRWNEPLIFALSESGQRGVAVPANTEPMERALSKSKLASEQQVRRSTAPHLPEVAQPQVLRHFLRLAQETLGADLNVDIGQGTCTMKYSPKVNERFISSAEAVRVHPLQDVSTIQGSLQIIYELEEMLAEISGMDAVCLQPGAGSAAIYTNVNLVKAYHQSRGDHEARREVVTTIFSHPSNAAAAKTAGYDIVTLYPDENGYPNVAALRSALSRNTAALFITNPEDTGIFNPDIANLVNAAHDVGALCVYDQANANGMLGVTNARAAGFDLCHFNLHKTFSTPHACGGPAAGAVCVTDALEEFLPGPRIVRLDDGTYGFEASSTHRIPASRPFYGVMPNLIRAYAWILALGAEGLREVANIAVLNNNYLIRKILEIEGVSLPYATGRYRIEQARYSWAELTAATGVSSGEVGRRMADFGLHYWTSHHPYVVAEPATIEPTESYSQRELDEYVEALRSVAQEAASDSDGVRQAPSRSSIHQIPQDTMNDPDTWAPSWRSYRRKYLGEAHAETPRWMPDERTPRKQRAAKVHHR